MTPGTRPKARGKTRFAGDQSAFVYGLTVKIVGLVLKYWVRRYQANGVEKMPSVGGLFLIANHSSAFDPFVMGYALRHRNLRGPGKVELFTNPVISYTMRKLGIFPIRTGMTDASGVRPMVELFRAGKAVIVYPEGGRSPTRAMQPFFPGFARLAIKLQAPLIPAAIAGASDVLPIGSLMPRRNVGVVVAIGDAFDLSDFYGRPLDDEAAAEAAQFLQDRVAELLKQAQAAKKELDEG